MPLSVIAQEIDLPIEQSAEVYLEEYSDTFQEVFFEALKQKGIENYDKAINLLLECKQADTKNHVVDHELAKVYHLNKQYVLAQDYALSALNAEPGNLWYLNTLVKITQMQGSSISDIKSNIPYHNAELKEHLALIYFKQNNYEGAMGVIREIEASNFTEMLTSKIVDSIKRREARRKKEEKPATAEPNINPLEELKSQLSDLMEINDLEGLKQLSEDALENYPSQPFMYYSNGYVLNRIGEYEEAAEILEAALDFMLDDVPLMNKIYQELVDSYTAMNNPSQANMYLRMIKPRF